MPRPTTARVPRAPNGCSGEVAPRGAKPRRDGRPMCDGPPVTRVPAVGGDRDVPAPDPIAREYLLLVLRLDQHVPGLVDGYFGPAELKAKVDLEQLRSPADLRANAADLRARLTHDVPEPDRRRWLAAQLVALEAQAAALAGDALPYLDHVTACFDHRPERVDERVFATAAEDLDRLLPGVGPLQDRIAASDARFAIPPDRLRGVVDAVLPRLRERAGAAFGLPEGEALAVNLVRAQPWSGYNWYDGGLRSRVDINTDLPVRAGDLPGLLAHEAYPGHHLEHAWKEAHQVERLRHLEASVLSINTPECLLSEGLADLGRRFAVPDDDEADLLAEVLDRAGIVDAGDRSAVRAAAETLVAVTRSMSAIRGVAGNAALLRHADGASHDEALAYLERWLLATPERCAKRLEFVEHPLWRTYVFVYFEGERLLRRWLEAVPEADRAARFRRLLVEQLSPGAIRDEVAGTAIADSGAPG